MRTLDRSLYDTLPEEEQQRLTETFAAINRGQLWHIKPEDILDRWRRTVEECEQEYDMNVDEYTNDLTVRELIEYIDARDPAADLTSFRSTVSRLDDRFVVATREIGQRLLGVQHPFFSRIPANPGFEFREDLVRQKFFPSFTQLETWLQEGRHA